MSEQKITLELTEAEAREIAGPAYCPGWLKERAQAALPPEWAEGTVAWVTLGDVTWRCIAARKDGRWITDSRPDGSNPTWLSDVRVTKVEPIRTLADDEIAVKRQECSARYWRHLADQRRGHHPDSATLADAYADALEKAGEPNA